MVKYFSTIFRVVVPFVVALFAAYLIGSFISAALNPELWEVELRKFMSIVGIVFGFALLARLRLDDMA